MRFAKRFPVLLAVTIVMATLAAATFGQSATPAAQQVRHKAAPVAAEVAAPTSKAWLPPPIRAVRPVNPDVVLSRSEVEVKVTGGVAEGTIKLVIDSQTSEMREVFVLPPSIALTDVTVRKGRDGVQVVRRFDGYHVFSARKGTLELEIEFAAAVEGKDLKKSVRLPLTGATVSTMTLTLPGTSLNVTVSPKSPIRTEEKQETTMVSIFGGQAGELTVEWLPKAPEVELEPKVFAEQKSTVHMGLGVLRLHSQIDYSIVQGKVESFSVKLPEGTTLLKVEGSDIRSWDIESDSGGRVLKVGLLGPVADRYQLSLSLEQAIDQPAVDGPVDVEMQLPEVLDVSRETGWIAIAAEKGLKAEAGQTEGVSQIDVREMPSVGGGALGAMHLGFKYVKRPIKVATRLSVVEAKVSGEVFQVVKISPESIRSVATIHYQIKEAGVFRFRIRLETDMRLADLEGPDINNWSLTNQVLSVDLRSKAEKQYTLKLVTEKQITGRTLEIPPLELLDVQRERGYIALEASAGTNVKPGVSEGITQINIKDLPETLPDRQGVTLAYRYIRHPYRLGVEISEVQPEIVATTETLIDVEATLVRIDYSVSYDIRKAGVFTLRLNVPQGLQILSLEGQDVDDWKHDKETGLLEVVLESRTEGAYALRLTAEQRTDGRAASTLALPNITCLDVRRETGHLAVRPEEGMRLTSGEGLLEDIREIDVKELPQSLQQKGVALAYKYFLQPWKASLQVESIEPYVTAEVFNFISLGEAYLQASATAKYFVQYAGIQTVRLQLPEGADNVDITAVDLKSKDEDKDNKGLWTLTFQAKRKGQIRVNISFQIKMDKEADRLVYTGLRALDVKQERGYVAVAPRSDLEVNAAEESKGVRPIDEREIPSDYTRGITGSMALSFRYPAAPFELHLSMVRREPAEVLVAVIGSCRLSTMITEDGNLITDAVYTMRNLRKQYLELVLPAGARIWHAYVDSKQKTPVTSRKNGETVTMIPIIGHGRNQQEFTVRLRYSYPVDPLGSFRRLQMKVPQTEIPALRVGWELALPEDYVVVRSWGTLSRVDRLDGELSRLSFMPPMAPVVLSGAAEGPQADMQAIQLEHNKRVMENADNITNFELSGPPVSLDISSGSKARFGDRQGPAVSMKRYYFQTLVALGEPPTLKVRCMTAAVHSVSRGVVALLVLVGAVVFWMRWSGTAWSKFLGTVSAALLVLAIRTLAGYAYTDYLTDLLWVLVGVAVVSSVIHVARALGSRSAEWSRRRAESSAGRVAPVAVGVGGREKPAGESVAPKFEVVPEEEPPQEEKPEKPEKPESPGEPRADDSDGEGQGDESR